MPKILLIEANPSHARLIRDRLREDLPSTSVKAVATLKEGIQVIGNRRFDCILTDAYAPDGSGPKLVEKLRKVSGTTPIIVVTGRGDERVATEMMRSGASDYLPKSRSSLEAISELVKKNVVKKPSYRSSFLIPAHVFGKILDEVEGVVSARVRKKIRKIRKNAEKILRI